MNQEGIELLSPKGDKPVKMWTQGVPVEPEAKQQLEKLAQLPFVFNHVSVMPQVPEAARRQQLRKVFTAAATARDA